MLFTTVALTALSALAMEPTYEADVDLHAHSVIHELNVVDWSAEIDDDDADVVVTVSETIDSDIIAGWILFNDELGRDLDVVPWTLQDIVAPIPPGTHTIQIAIAESELSPEPLSVLDRIDAQVELSDDSGGQLEGDPAGCSTVGPAAGSSWLLLGALAMFRRRRS